MALAGSSGRGVLDQKIAFQTADCSIFAKIMKESYFIPVLTGSHLTPSLYLRKGE